MSNPLPPIPSLNREAMFRIPSKWGGTFDLLSYGTPTQNCPVIVLMQGDLENAPVPLVRIQSSCLTGEALGSALCDCADQLHDALAQIGTEACGALIYLQQEARGNGLLAKLRIYEWMQDHKGTSEEACLALGYPVDARTYELAAAVLRSLGVSSLRLITNNPHKVASLESYGFSVTRVKSISLVIEYNRDYLRWKKAMQGHDLDV